jgi:hypothetical protein
MYCPKCGHLMGHEEDCVHTERWDEWPDREVTVLQRDESGTVAIIHGKDAGQSS